MAGRNGTVPGVKLLAEATCPHCWQRFPPEDVLWVAANADLLGDPLLGQHEGLRFRPSRFTFDGAAVDPNGVRCSELACPRCHLVVPRELLEIRPLFLSVLGAPASGKSFSLTAATWMLRRHLAQAFDTLFVPLAGEANLQLALHERNMFNNPDASRPVPLTQLIPKTQERGEQVYDAVHYDHLTVNYPRPILFSLTPAPGHPYADYTRSLARVVCLYDIAGEHCEQGKDSPEWPVTNHLAHSSAFLMVFDPTLDHRFRSAYEGAWRGSGPESRQAGVRLSPQEPVFVEAARRVRALRGHSHAEQHDRPLIIVLTKFDQWSHLLRGVEPGDPWVSRADGRIAGLDLEKIEAVSRKARNLLFHYGAEIVSAAESFARHVTYIPVSALGDGIEPVPDPDDPARSVPGIRPERIRPHWASVPFLYALRLAMPELIARRKTQPDAPIPSPA